MTRIITSIAFEPELLKKVDEARGHISRSVWLMLAVEKILKEEDSKKKGAA